MDGISSPPHARRRLIAWILWSAVSACVVLAIAVVLWFWLPRWAPVWVIHWSPWVDPALRATTGGGGSGVPSMGWNDNPRLDEFRSRLDDWGATATPALIRALASSNERERSLALDGLLYFAGRKLLDRSGSQALIALVDDAQEGIQRIALWRLGYLADGLGEEWINDLGDRLILLLGSGREQIRNEVFQQLLVRVERGQLTAPQIAQVIALLHDRRSAMRLSAVDLLANSKAPLARAAVVAVMHDPDATVATRALMMVADREPQEATPLLIALLEGPRDPPLAPGVRAAALESLINRYDAPGKLAALIHACADSDPVVRLIALGGVDGYPGAEVDALFTTLLRDRDAEVASAARNVAARRSLPAVLPQLIAALGHADGGERYAAIGLLVAFGGPRLVELLNTRLHDEDPVIRARVAWGLDESNDEQAVTPLLQLLADPVCRVRKAAVAALRRNTSDPRIADAILDCLEAGLLRPDTGDLPQVGPRELEEAVWFNEVIDAIDARNLTDEQRRRLPDRRPVPRARQGFSSPAP